MIRSPVALHLTDRRTVVSVFIADSDISLSFQAPLPTLTHFFPQQNVRWHKDDIWKDKKKLIECKDVMCLSKTLIYKILLRWRKHFQMLQYLMIYFPVDVWKAVILKNTIPS